MERVKEEPRSTWRNNIRSKKYYHLLIMIRNITRDLHNYCVLMET